MPDLVTGSTYLEIIKIILNMGPIGLVIVLAWLWKQQVDTTMRKWQEDTNALLRMYRDDMMEQRRMYENNVELVKRYECLAGDLKDVVLLVSQTLQRLCDNIQKEHK